MKVVRLPASCTGCLYPQEIRVTGTVRIVLKLCTIEFELSHGYLKYSSLMKVHIFMEELKSLSLDL
jgi:hypothetical protein